MENYELAKKLVWALAVIILTIYNFEIINFNFTFYRLRLLHLA